MTLQAYQNETQEMIRSSLSFLQNQERLSRVRDARHVYTGFFDEDWQQFAELGMLGLCVGEARGGSGLGVYEAVVVAEEMGKGLVHHSLLNAILAAPLVPNEAIDSVVSGEQVILPAWQECAIDPLKCETIVQNGRLLGDKQFIPVGRNPTQFLVIAANGSKLVDLDSNDAKLSYSKTHDGGRFGHLALNDVEGGETEVDRIALANRLLVGTAGYLLGVAQRAFDITHVYLQTREQFGHPIGSFQVLQHRAVDLLKAISVLRAGVYRAAREIDSKSSEKAITRRVSRVMARAAETSMLVSRQGIQMHGGIGFTDEADIGLFLRKAMVMAYATGSPKWHRRRYGASIDIPKNRLEA